MIKVFNEGSYDWLLNNKDIKSRYIRKFIENYIEELFNIKINLSDDNIEFDLESSALFGSIKKILDTGKYYKIDKIISDEYTNTNIDYESIDCKYSHFISIIGDFENYNYLFIVNVDDNAFNLLSDQELINLYKLNDKLLLSLLDGGK